MPRINVRRESEEGGYYHVYNRGIEKKSVFRDEKDSGKFIAIIADMLTSPNTVFPSSRLHFNGELELIAYCLMGNHYHFVCLQNTDQALARFMKSLLVRYTRYFNEKYSRVGPIFDGRYRARKIDSDEDLVNIAKYVHQNPTSLGADPTRYKDSSLRLMIDGAPPWLSSTPLLANRSFDEYLRFVTAA